jgi:hypothetical protein
MTQRPSHEQLRVLTLMCAASSPDIAYYRGGFWGTPGQAVVGPFEAPIRWHTSTQTLRGLEKKGWVIRVRGTGPRGLATLEKRRLTDLGRQTAAKYAIVAGSVKPVVVEGT